MSNKAPWRTPSAPGVLLCALLCVVAVACAPDSQSDMACASNPPLAAPGEAFVLQGDGFYIGCNDTGQGRPEPPDKGVDLVFRQGDRTWHVATVAADRNYAFRKRLVVPVGAKPGKAAVIASGSTGRVSEGFLVRR